MSSGARLVVSGWRKSHSVSGDELGINSLCQFVSLLRECRESSTNSPRFSARRVLLRAHCHVDVLVPAWSKLLIRVAWITRSSKPRPINCAYQGRLQLRLLLRYAREIGKIGQRKTSYCETSLFHGPDEPACIAHRPDRMPVSPAQVRS